MPKIPGINHLDAGEVAVDPSELHLAHFPWDAAMPERRAEERHPARLSFVGRNEAFVFDTDSLEALRSPTMPNKRATRPRSGALSGRSAQ